MGAVTHSSIEYAPCPVFHNVTPAVRLGPTAPSNFWSVFSNSALRIGLGAVKPSTTLLAHAN